ncbi:MAG TPA: LLM class F420-dependent oxidoreductase [Acidimicrobiales bacterium]|jgi:probable F420-dependent oxidoreductase|nr:LLM class F420-dependent oxidoreductase [Acidimicrobiales bacterium]
MNYWVTYPMVVHPHNPEFVTKSALTRFCGAAEAAGFAGIGFTDHPAPSDRWLKAGGHDALDPFAALAFCAAVTDTMRLIPNIVVLPYRNPFVVAKAAATLNALSDGRFTLAVATGYMRGEYQALGVDFSQRNALFDEAIEVIRSIWSEDDYAHEGMTFTAKGQSANPKPDPHPPIWIGGNSQASRRRVARYGNGWSPFPAPRILATTTKSAPLETVDDLRPMLEELWGFLDEAGRDPGDIDVSFGSGAGGSLGSARFNADAQLTADAELAELGVTWSGVGVPGHSLEHAIEALEQFGQAVIH